MGCCIEVGGSRTRADLWERWIGRVGLLFVLAAIIGLAVDLGASSDTKGLIVIF